MKQGPLIILIVLIVVIGATVALYMVESTRQIVGPAGSATSTSLVGQAIFTDGEHGFSIRYPQTDQADYTFESNTHLPAVWRVNALTNATGTPLVSFIAYRTENANSYPRFFDAEVRIGASSDPKEVAACETAQTDQGEELLNDVALNGTMFKAFSFESAAAMQYVKGVSYRAVHDGSCIAIEKLETGSSYHDDPPSAADIPQAKLDDAYASLDAIVASFSFARP